jgi:hypothetical protein
MPARYIVGGTMLKHTDGYLINARIVGMQSQAVVASAQSFIPNSVVYPLISSASIVVDPNKSNLNINTQTTADNKTVSPVDTTLPSKNLISLIGN